MSFEQLKQAILAEADQHVAQIEASGRERLHHEESRLREHVRAAEEGILDEAKVRAQREARRVHQEHQLNAKARVLFAKQQELLTTQQQVIEHILGWDEQETAQLLGALLSYAAPEDVIVPGERHAAAVRSLAAAQHLTVADDVLPGDGGIRITSTDGAIDLTIGALVGQLFARHRAALAQRLFA